MEEQPCSICGTRTLNMSLPEPGAVNDWLCEECWDWTQGRNSARGDYIDLMFSFPRVQISDEELLEFVKIADAEMEAESIPVSSRPLRLMGKIRQHLGIGLTNRHPLYRRGARMLETLYPARDVSILPVHRGAFLYRESIYELSVGQVFGKVAGVDLMSYLPDMPPVRMEQLRASEEDLRRFVDQVCDLDDFGRGVLDLSKGEEGEAIALLELGKSHLEAAAVAAIETKDREASLHSCFLGTELLLKGAVSARGAKEKRLRKLGHDLQRLVSEASQAHEGLNQTRLLKAIGNLPQGVGERYRLDRPGEERVGHALMSAQYVGGAILRQMTDRDLRASLKVSGRPQRFLRVYP